MTACALALLCAEVVPAAAQQSAALTEQDRADVARIEAYLDGIHTLKSRFLQIAANGDMVQGTLYVSRPEKMRVEYDGPVPFLIVATGVWLVFYDGELQQTSYLPIDASPASVLIQDRVDLGGDVTVADFERSPGALRIALTETDSPEKGTLHLTFSDQPLRLRDWTVIDPQGQATQVTLLNPEFNIELKPVLFKYSAPGPDQFSAPGDFNR